MKLLNLSFAIIVGILFFTVVGCEEFSRYDDIQTEQPESLNSNIKSAPVVASPSESVSFVTVRNEEGRKEGRKEGRADAEAKPKTDIKPADVNPVTETKPEGKPVPTAVPVVTVEEAEKLNEFALFLSKVKTTVVEGEIVERSELPDPQKSDYPNCRFTAHFNGNSIRSGEPCPKELSLIIEGFENYRILPNNDIKNGDKVQLTIFPFEELPEEHQSTQQADDLKLFLLESYYVLDISTIKEYTDNELMPISGIYFSDGNADYISLFDRHINPPVPQDLIDAQKNSIQKDLQKITKLLEEYDDDKIEAINKLFAEAWEKEKAKDPPNYNRVGDYVWRNIDNSFWCLPVNYTFLSKTYWLTKESLDAFSALKKSCEANGVQLIVSLIPNLYVIASRVINKDFRTVLDIQTAIFVKQLSEVGIETIYPSDAIILNYNRYPFSFFFPDDTHPSDTVQCVITDILAERLTRYNLKAELDFKLFSERQSPHSFGDDERFLFPKNCDIGENQSNTSYNCREILYEEEPIYPSKDAPIIIIGNSFQQTPMEYPDSLPTLLSQKTNTRIDWYRIGGQGPFSDIMIQLLTRPEFFLKNKKVLVMYIGTDHLRAANHSGYILNISDLDTQRTLLNNKNNKGCFSLLSNVDESKKNDSSIWGPLANTEKTVLATDETGELSYRFSVEQACNSFSDSEPVILVVPHTCADNTICKMTVNGIMQTMHCSNSAKRMRFFNLAYELPAGTKEISVQIQGRPGSLIAIKDIQIWQ